MPFVLALSLGIVGIVAQFEEMGQPRFDREESVDAFFKFALIEGQEDCFRSVSQIGKDAIKHTLDVIDLVHHFAFVKGGTGSRQFELRSPSRHPSQHFPFYFLECLF